MRPPTLEQVRAHVPRGALWRIIPRQSGTTQHPPVYVVLMPATGRIGVFVSLNGGDTPEEHLARPEHKHLVGAEWVPCDPKGDRL